MDPKFWRERWQSGQIGFDQGEVNADLRALWPRLQCPAEARVFVPLCGKSIDMVWLRDLGHVVVGIELSELAVAAFFAERQLQPVRKTCGELQRWSAGGYELYVGDFFALDAAMLANVRAVYDRAALIALPAALRERYAQHLAHTLPAGCRMLLVTLNYPPDQMDGPPFAVAEPEVLSLFERAFSVRKLSSRDALAEEPRFQKRGLKSLKAEGYQLVRSAAEGGA